MPLERPAHKTILVVDDDTSIRESLSELLTDAGYSVLTAANGLEGLECLKESLVTNKPRLIILDMRMPLMDGWEFKSELDGNPDLMGIPVLVFSAFAGESPPKISANGVIAKPIDVDALLEAVKPFLS